MTKAVSPETWEAARLALLAREKEYTRHGDALAAERRRLPRLKVEKTYRFETPEGDKDLEALFDERSQLIVYHHMLKTADPAPCSGCSMVGDSIPHLAHLHARDTSLVFVSTAPPGEIEKFRRRMGWAMPFVRTTDEFNADHGVTTGFGLNVFLRENGEIYRTYFTTSRGVESLGSVWSLLDLTPRGRQESWESSPEGTPQSSPYSWWRLHDEY